MTFQETQVLEPEDGYWAGCNGIDQEDTNLENFPLNLIDTNSYQENDGPREKVHQWRNNQGVIQTIKKKSKVLEKLELHQKFHR